MINKKAQTAPVGLAIIVGIFLFLVGMSAINILKPDITLVRGITSGLNCDNSSNISDGTKLTCLAIDWIVPGFIISVLSLVGGLITFKVLR